MNSSYATVMPRAIPRCRALHVTPTARLLRLGIVYMDADQAYSAIVDVSCFLALCHARDRVTKAGHTDFTAQLDAMIEHFAPDHERTKDRAQVALHDRAAARYAFQVALNATGISLDDLPEIAEDAGEAELADFFGSLTDDAEHAS